MHRRLAVRGLVQGVGFRPWVWQQATELGLIGWVRNTPSGVEIDLHGDAALIDTLQARLWHIPAPAKVDQVEVIGLDGPAETNPLEAPKAFEIQASVSGTASRATTVGADLGVCSRCLADMFEPTGRRWRHAFAHCPQCGPRYTVIRSLPFDRAHTSMARFAPCPDCQAEYNSPAERRFHHQTNACPQCGPRLWLRLGDGSLPDGDPIAGTLALLREGGIVAIKGLGGYHLVCNARDSTAVARLRQRKGREAKPLAVMVANTASLPPWADATDHAQRWLASSERPIVLLPQTERARTEMPGVSPDLAWLGVMLPYTPLHYLLYHEAAGQPAGTDWLSQPQDMVLVMTSGNASGEPLAIDNEAAVQELAELADAWLMHDRDILARNDDSVLRVRPDGSACFLRRGRGYAPMPVAVPTRNAPPALPDGLDAPLPSVLAVGALLKATLCITQGDRAMVSPHVGDLDEASTRHAFSQLADHWPAWLNTQPDALACDLHPDFFSTLLAGQLAASRASSGGSKQPLPLIQVQHHHAHIAAVLAEHASHRAAFEPVIGLALDGHGLGSDGQAWGGELLRVHGAQVQRLGHLLPLPLPGGDKAAREPWRMAAAVLHVLGHTDDILTHFGTHPHAAMLHSWLKTSGHNVAQTTSLGRLFDAAAGLLQVLGPLEQVRFEAEAAMRLESLASQALPLATAPDPAPGLIIADGLLDWRPLMRWLLTHQGALDPAHLAATFHAALAQGLANWAIQACEAQGIGTVVLAGGCMANSLLDDALTTRIAAAGLRVWRPEHYPCGDGGLSLGQAWVAREHLLSSEPRWTL
jgi:hydrogenase maturation protein HypF